MNAPAPAWLSGNAAGSCAAGAADVVGGFGGMVLGVANEPDDPQEHAAAPTAAARAVVRRRGTSRPQQRMPER